MIAPRIPSSAQARAAGKSLGSSQAITAFIFSTRRLTLRCLSLSPFADLTYTPVAAQRLGRARLPLAP